MYREPTAASAPGAAGRDERRASDIQALVAGLMDIEDALRSRVERRGTDAKPGGRHRAPGPIGGGTPSPWAR